LNEIILAKKTVIIKNYHNLVKKMKFAFKSYHFVNYLNNQIFSNILLHHLSYLKAIKKDTKRK